MTGYRVSAARVGLAGPNVSQRTAYRAVSPQTGMLSRPRLLLASLAHAMGLRDYDYVIPSAAALRLSGRVVSPLNGSAAEG